MQELADPTMSFLSALGGSENALFTFQTLPEATELLGTRIVHGTYKECITHLQELNCKYGHGIFVTVQETDGLGRKAENIRAARALFVDNDDPSRGVPLAVPLPPSARVQTSPGKEHIYWFLRPGESLDRVLEALKTLARELGTDPNVCKLPQIMRLPGFWHCKGTPVPSQLIELNNYRYTIDEVLQSLTKPNQQHLQHYAAWQYARVLDRLRLSDKGDRNNAIHRAAWMAKEFVRDGFLAEDRVRADLLDIALRLPGQPPISEREALTAIESGLRSSVRSDNYLEATQAIAAAPPAPGSAPASTQATGSAMQPPGDGRRTFASGQEADLARSFLTDCGAGAGLLRSLGGELWGYDARLGVWKTLEIERLRSYIQTYHGAWVYPPNGRISQVSMNPRRRDAILDMALYDAQVLDPTFFDSAPIGVQFADGWASIRDGQLIHEPSSPEHRCRTLLPFPLLSGPEPSAWLQFLSELFPEDQSLPLILQEAIGGAMFGMATQFARCAILQGSGSNGKSVLLTALARHLFPAQILSYVPPGRWGQEYYVYALRNSLLNLVGELPGWNLVNTDAFKSIISGDPVIGRPPYGKPLSFRPRALHVFCANELPATRDYSHGFWRRFLVLPFAATFDGATLPEQILARFEPERSGMARWALAGAQRLLQQGAYTKAESQRKAEAEWRLDSDPVFGFLQLCCVKNGGRTGASELYRSFRLWCESNGRYPVSGTRFGRRLRELGLDKQRGSSGQQYQITVLPAPQWDY